MGNSTKELVNAFNLNNYFSDKVSTNFTVEGKKIVGLFASDINIGKYLQRIEEEIIKRHYGTKELATEFYNLDYFPFALGANANKKHLGKGVVELADSTDDKVICNLKIHFANELKRVVEAKVDTRLQKAGIMEKEAHEWIRGTVGTGAIGEPYLYCIAFSDEYLKRKYDSETFEVLKGMYIQEFNLRLRECGLKGSDFYEYKDGMLYIKNIGDEVVKNVAKYVKKEVALDFRTPGKEDSKVENFKDVLSSLMSKQVRKSINVYDYDTFTDENKIKNGHNFALIPFIEMDDGQFETLSSRDASKINRVFNGGIFNGFTNDNFISDIRGKTANPQFANCKEPVYAFSNQKIALLLPMIMESPIAYNQINKCFEFAVDLGNFKRRGSSRSSSTVDSPTHAGPSGLRTPPKQRQEDVDSGYGSNGNSPPKKDSVKQLPEKVSSKLNDVRLAQVRSPTCGQDVALKESARQGSEKEELVYNQLGLAESNERFPPSTRMSSTAVNHAVSRELKSAGAAQNVQVGPSAWLPWLLQDTQSPQPPQLIEPVPSCSFRQEPSQVFMVNESPLSGWRINNKPLPSNKLNDKEKELIKALLYTLNLTNYTLDGVYTNFFAKDGKIVSLLHDNVDREKYLRAVKASIIKKYCGTKEEARKLYDLDEFPFKFLPDPDYEPKKTVVANISSGALSNLKILFSQKFGKNVDAIDISAVKKVEEREKDECVDLRLSEGDSLRRACKSCFPDEGPMKTIPIAFEGGEYVLDRSYGICEVELLLKEQLRRFRGTLVNEEEKELFKALLYVFNLNNYILECSHTNFIVKNGKIASLINDGVNVEEYLQEVIDKTKEEYRVNEKEAYDLNEFPFKFLSNCEKNQETTVVANISCGALFNLKKLFIQKHEKKVEIGDIDTNIVKKDVKSKKDEWINSQVREDRVCPDAAITSCYPDESALEYISITKDKGGYWIDRDYDASEVKLFREERWPAKAKGTRNATITFKKIEESKKDDSSSGYSSGSVTDAENVSSKAEEKTRNRCLTSDPEPMDCKELSSTQQKSPWSEDEGSSSESSRSGSSNSSPESDGENTGKGSPKRTLELSMENLRISTDLNATKAEQHSPTKKFRSN